MADELNGPLGCKDKVAEVDGGHFGGYVKPTSLKENRRDNRMAKNQNGKREMVVIVCERGGGEHVVRIARLAMARNPSIDFSSYWQRHSEMRG